MQWLTVIESPFAGDTERNIAYAKSACLHAIGKDEVPFASHLFFPQFLDDEVEADRELGITAGYAWVLAAKKDNSSLIRIAFYVDHGWSRGMEAALTFYTQREFSCEIRRIYSEG